MPMKSSESEHFQTVRNSPAIARQSPVSKVRSAQTIRDRSQTPLRFRTLLNLSLSILKNSKLGQHHALKLACLFKQSPEHQERGAMKQHRPVNAEIQRAPLWQLVKLVKNSDRGSALAGRRRESLGNRLNVKPSSLSILNVPQCSARLRRPL